MNHEPEGQVIQPYTPQKYKFFLKNPNLRCKKLSVSVKKSAINQLFAIFFILFFACSQKSHRDKPEFFMKKNLEVSEFFLIFAASFKSVLKP